VVGLYLTRFFPAFLNQQAERGRSVEPRLQSDLHPTAVEPDRLRQIYLLASHP
jgi:hypothetical protein